PDPAVYPGSFRPRAARFALRSRDDRAGVGARLPMGYRAAGPCRDPVRKRAMSASITPSQTVGPFFGVGLPFEKGEQIAPAGSAGSFRVECQGHAGHGAPVPDALLEVWQP